MLEEGSSAMGEVSCVECIPTGFAIKRKSNVRLVLACRRSEWRGI
jgi:hypothetical protein